MYRILPSLYLAVFNLVSVALLMAEQPSASLNPAYTYRGWDYIVQKLLNDGMDKDMVNQIYLSEKMPPLEEVYFKIKPKEPQSIYSVFKNKKLIKKAADYLKLNQSVFASAEKKYGVDRNVIVSIMLVETHLGTNTGDNLIINRLSRIGSIAKPENIKANFKIHSEENPKITLKQVADRAKYLEDRFYPEVLALMKMSEDYKIDLLELKGSFAGAFGIPQFLPSTFLNYAVDGNKDGKISLFNKDDSIHSIANYLSKSGWKDSASQKEKESVIWEYNHSEPYIDTVLYIAGILKRGKL